MSINLAPSVIGQVAVPAAVEAVTSIAQGLDFAQLLSRGSEKVDQTKESRSQESFVSILGSGRQTADWAKQLHDAVETLNEFLSQFKSGSRGIEIRGDGAGGLVVDADAETRASIEGQLNQDPSLAQSFNQLFEALFKLDPATSNSVHPGLTVESSDEFAAVGRGDKSPNPIAFSLSQHQGRLTARAD